ncbi:MAG: VWA domain-containing protein [Akkermansiaceae bacterium]|nr:VWA domain-containing protein [Akkermansiaceae bacterium]
MNLHTTLTLPLFAAFLAALAPRFAPASPGTESNRPENEKTLAPYFVVIDAGNDENGSEPFPLKRSTIDARVSGIIADVTVKQSYRNTGSRALEAVYVFPASTRAAVHGLTMEIGGRTIEAKIAEKKAAAQQYEQAKRENKTAALLEQERPNVFRMSVGHILPGDDVDVTLRYTEMLAPEAGVHEFVFPTVVGPRYSRGTPEAEASSDWVANPYLQAGTPDPAAFELSLSLDAGMPVRDIASPSHAIAVQYEGKNRARVGLARSDPSPANRDFVLRYRLSGERIDSGLLLHEDETRGEKFFLLTVQPPKRVAPEDLPGREYVFVVDVSGSMVGFPLDTAKGLLKDLIGGLRPRDRFNVVLFASASRQLSDVSLPATDENLGRALALLENERGGGGTEFDQALETAMQLPAAEGFSRSIVLVTDGFVDFERQTFASVRENLGAANLFPLGIGSSVNRFLIEGLARAGQTEPLVVLHPGEAKDAAAKLRQMIAAPVLTDIAVDFGPDFEVYEVEPKSYPDVFADRPLAVFGKYRGTPGGTVSLSGVTGNERRTLSVDVAKAAADSAENTALPYLWARHRIAARSDDFELNEDAEAAREVTNLGLTYGLLTRFTSFVAVDEVARPAGDGAGETEKVTQASPLPRGVPASAVGGTIPEPGSAILWLIGLGWLAFRRTRRRAA